MKRMAAMCLAVLGALAPAAALAEDPYAAPARAAEIPWIAICYSAGFVALACVAAFKSANRTHLD